VLRCPSLIPDSLRHKRVARDPIDAAIDLDVPGRPLGPSRGGPERQGCPRPDGTGSSVRAGPWRTGTTRARAVTNSHQQPREDAGRVASSSGSSPNGNRRIQICGPDGHWFTGRAPSSRPF
jgi:hypothetical protein